MTAGASPWGAGAKENPVKKILAPVLIAAGLACLALPAVAQPYGAPQSGGHGLQLRKRADQLERRIQRGVNDHTLDRREADRSLADLADVRRLEDALLGRGHGFLSVADRRTISARLDQLERNIRWLRGGDRR